jgi:uncharacterized membrane protein YqjE
MFDMTTKNTSEGSLRDAGAALAGLVGTRVELLGIELREEGLNLQRMLAVAIVAAFVLGTAFVLAAVMVAAFFWDTHRMLALAALTAIYAVGALAALAWIRSSMKRRALPFHATAREFQADLQALSDAARSPQP